EQAAFVARAVATLPDKYRTALLLAASGDYTFDEMAEAIGVPAGTLKWRVSEARRMLKTRLNAAGHGACLRTTRNSTTAPSTRCSRHSRNPARRPRSRRA